MSRFAYQPLQIFVIFFVEKNQATSEKKNIFFVERLRDFSPKHHINLERLIGRSAHRLNLERLISAHLILGGQICLCYGKVSSEML